jgi:hypothetical protein
MEWRFYSFSQISGNQWCISKWKGAIFTRYQGTPGIVPKHEIKWKWKQTNRQTQGHKAAQPSGENGGANASSTPSDFSTTEASVHNSPTGMCENTQVSHVLNSQHWTLLKRPIMPSTGTSDMTQFSWSWTGEIHHRMLEASRALLQGEGCRMQWLESSSFQTPHSSAPGSGH